MKKFSHPIFLSILSGIFIGTSYIPFPPWALFFCVVPLWLVWQHETSYKSIFFTGWITQFVLALIGFHWIPHTIVEFGHLPLPAGLMGLIAYAAFSNLHYPLAGVVWNAIRKRYPLTLYKSLIVLATITVILETLTPQLFPWNLGYPWLWAQLPGYHWADTIGFIGLSYITLLFNAWILFSILKISKQSTIKKSVLAMVFVFLFIQGTGYLKHVNFKEPKTSRRILVVQANIGNYEKLWEVHGRKYKRQTIDKYLKITEPALDKDPRWLLWPETAVPEFLNYPFSHPYFPKRILGFIKTHNLFFVTGAYGQNPRTRQQSNSMYFLSPEPKKLGSYKKSILLAFGEYLPGAQYIPDSIIRMIPTIANFERGQGPTAILMDGIQVGPQICYEGLYPEFSRNSVKAGAQLFMNVTNDSWFGHTFEPYQHLYMTLGRAIEMRRPLIRSTNTGISTAITASGKILPLSEQKTEGTYLYDLAIDTSPQKTIYYYIQPYFLYILLAIILIMILTSRYARISESRLEKDT